MDGKESRGEVSRAGVRKCAHGAVSRPIHVLLIVVFAALLAPSARAQEDAPNPYATVVMLLASPDEGARMFSMARLLPPDHPVAIGHDFPTLQTIHPFEVDVLVHLGEQVGLGLRPTLERHKKPSIIWPHYPQFQLPPVEAIRAAPIERRAAAAARVPGLRAVAFVDGLPAAVLIDTRGLSLAERGMQRPTTSGLDITRAHLDEELSRIAADLPSEGSAIVVFGESRQ